MDLRFVAVMALREIRAGRRRMAFLLVPVTLGVAALVAVNAFRSDIRAAVGRESRALLGADVQFSRRDSFPDLVTSLFDSLQRAGAPVSFVTEFASMALLERTGLTRLIDVQAIEGGYPFYGSLDTEPAGRRAALDSGRMALVEPTVLVQLDARLGDSVRIGDAAFEIVAAVTGAPGDVGLRSVIGPRVYIPAAYVEQTGLLRFGSRAHFMAFVALDDADTLQAFLDRSEPMLDSADVGVETARDREEDWARTLDLLVRFLGLVGLVALFLGGIGVASAIHVYVKRKLDTVAVLRCLGASQSALFAVYLLQAAALGAAGSLLGVALGLGVQRVLPGVLADFLPLAIVPAAHPGWILAGLAIGVGVAVVFALLPLLTIREVTPLRALRREFDAPTPRRDLVRIGAYAVLVAAVVGLAVWQAPFPTAGLGFAAAAAGGAGLLWAVAWALTRATRRIVPAHAPYAVRQGVANLHRPHNQTVAVTLAVGSGVFLLGTLQVVQYNLLTQLSLETSPDRPNLVVFDIQPDQRDDVAAIAAERGARLRDLTPLVPARITAINDRSVDEMLHDSVGPVPERWALRREYRHTYRDTLTDSETLTAGSWFDAPRGSGTGENRPMPRISVEEDLAAELRVRLGDRITWDIQGVLVETRVASLRRVDWARFDTNFFVVFEPGILESAPHTYVALLNAPGTLQRAELQRDLVRRHSNLSAVDVTLLIATLDRVIGSVATAIRFMAAFTLASGLLVLFGAIATSRLQRLRESVLLKTLGAAGPELRAILATEYAALGALAGLTGTLLAGIAGWAAVRFLFALSFHFPALPLLGFAVGSVAVTLAVGLLSSREVFRRPPLAVLREMGE